MQKDIFAEKCFLNKAATPQKWLTNLRHEYLIAKYNSGSRGWKSNQIARTHQMH